MLPGLVIPHLLMTPDLKSCEYLTFVDLQSNSNLSVEEQVYEHWIWVKELVL